MNPKTAAALTLALVALTDSAVGQGRQSSDAANRPQAAGGAIVTGRVLSGRAAAERASPSGYHIVLFPDDPSKWAFPSRYVQSTRSREDGTFFVRALPPNDRYLAVAVDYLEDDEATDPEFLQAIRGAATPFALRRGETSVVELKLVER